MSPRHYPSLEELPIEPSAGAELLMALVGLPPMSDMINRHGELIVAGQKLRRKRRRAALKAWRTRRSK
jgi:hypothetical protein